MRARFRRRAAVLASVVGLSWCACLLAALGPARSCLQAGDRLAREWRYREALAQYLMAERLAEGDERVEAAVGAIGAAVRAGEFEAAYRKAADLANARPGDARVHRAYGEAAWGNGLFDAAEAAFERALAANPADPRAHLGMARALVARRELRQALEHVLLAQAFPSEESDARYLAGTVYERLGLVEDAARSYLRYLALAPAIAADKRQWVAAEIEVLRSLGSRAPAFIEPASLARPHTIVFNIVNDKMVVPASVNGGTPIDLTVDTGAETMVLSSGTARRFGVVAISNTLGTGVGDAGLRDIQNGVLRSLRIGSLAVRDVRCFINPSGSEAATAQGFSPLALGLSMIVDYERRELTLGRDLPAARYDAELSLSLYRLPTVHGGVDDAHGGRFIVDTGARAISIGSDSERVIAGRAGIRRVAVPVYGLSGRDRDAHVLLGVDIAFGPVALQRAPVLALDLRRPGERLGYRLAGIMGQQLLNKYRVAIDLKRMVVGLSRRSP